LTTNRPRTFGEAGRLAGVTPADVAALLIHTTRLEAVAR
jgi:tRNA U34 5-carboxymethylaminomethyl modifying enzyme MnmG/GidA